MSSKKNKKSRKGKSYKPKFGREFNLGFAERVIKQYGRHIKFVIGTAWDEVQMPGFADAIGDAMVTHPEGVVAAGRVGDAIQERLRNVKRNWTTVYAFLDNKDDEIDVIVDWFMVKEANAREVDAVNRLQITEEWKAKRPKDPLGQVWFTMPVETNMSDEDVMYSMFEDLDEWFEESKMFDVEHMKERFAAIYKRNCDSNLSDMFEADMGDELNELAATVGDVSGESEAA